MKSTWKLLHALAGLLLSCSILALIVTFVLHFRPLYVRDLRAYDLPGATGFSEEKILAQYDALIAYNTPGGPEELVFPDLPASEGGLTHFAEVKTIFLRFQYLALPCALLAAGLILFLRRQRPYYLKYAGLLALAIPTVVGLGILLLWDRVFVLFHQLVFHNDLWLFDWRTDPIILFLPDGYFMHCALLMAGLFLASGVLLLLLWGLLRRRTPQKPAPAPAAP